MTGKMNHDRVHRAGRDGVRFLRAPGVVAAIQDRNLTHAFRIQRPVKPGRGVERVGTAQADAAGNEDNPAVRRHAKAAKNRVDPVLRRHLARSVRRRVNPAVAEKAGEDRAGNMALFVSLALLVEQIDVDNDQGLVMQMRAHPRRRDQRRRRRWLGLRKLRRRRGDNKQQPQRRQDAQCRLHASGPNLNDCPPFQRLLNSTCDNMIFAYDNCPYQALP